MAQGNCQAGAHGNGKTVIFEHHERTAFKPKGESSWVTKLVYDEYHCYYSIQ